MGVFGGFVYGGGAGGDVYGPDIDIVSAEMISADMVRVTVEAAVVVDDAYNEPTNYTVTPAGGGTLNVRQVLPVNTKITTEIILVIDRAIKGQTYTVSVSSNVRGTQGQTVEGSAEFVSRRTKIETLLRGMPAHYDTMPGSNIRSVLTAIGLSDDLIGGSLDAPVPE